MTPSFPTRRSSDLVAYTNRLQLHLAYDISVLYGVPLDTSDLDDLWKLVRIAFTIKSGEFVREGVLKTVPAMMRPLIKRFYSKSALAAAKGFPVVGKYLLQRNVIKVGDRKSTRLNSSH